MNLTLRIILAVLATFRASQMIPFESGPFTIFSKIRNGAGKKAAKEQEKGREGIWTNLAELANCPYCEGIYIAAVMAILIIFQSAIGDFIIIWLGIAGAQTILQNISYKLESDSKGD